MKNQFKKIQITIVASLFALTIHSQQIGNGLANGINDFTVPLLSGAYCSLNPTGSIPENNWQHLFVIRHPNLNNNYQLQIASSIADNDKLYFRKLASGDTSSINPNWYELATRGANNFSGNQTITGNVGIGVSNPTEKLEIYNSDTTPAVISLRSNRNDGQFVDVGRISAKQAYGEIARIGMPRSGGAYTGYLTFWTKADNNGDLTEKVRIAENGNMGIGTINPRNTLDVNGTIRSKEVKVELKDWSDFVFKKEYNLPTLKEVEKHIAEKGHLENIPSEKEVIKSGINLGEMNARLLQKIEELTLYAIEQNNKIEKLQEENIKLVDIEKRLLKIENKE
ncbi:hypothetical protein [Flavobacterium branchiicola]|uniref:Peptidase S74 domain-containing protein n=1 Tax=Flavobacterium branchiicola TaxID=1114875 RepID=A0ABV9PIJ8_9FLAO|nr:hypothetical protein [Flavobacterium branchiicola]MBS7255150.1 hypothetical protein [Flavobacterium branchiicola]